MKAASSPAGAVSIPARIPREAAVLGVKGLDHRAPCPALPGRLLSMADNFRMRAAVVFNGGVKCLLLLPEYVASPLAWCIGVTSMYGQWKVEETGGQDYVEIISPDGRLRGVYDKDADVAQVQLTTERVSRGKLVDDLGKIVEYDREGRLASIQFLYCSDGITMDEVPEEVREQAVRTVRRLGITVRDG